MGKPKFSRKKYDTPSHPWQQDRITAENELTKKYGLKNKREIWKAKTKIRNYRGQARGLRARLSGNDAQSKKEIDQLLMHLNKMNILPPNSTLDDILGLQTENILSRRLQTIAYLKGLSSTPVQARQLIIHGHVAIDKKRVTIPGYIVSRDEEGEIGYTSDSPLNDIMHPARPHADFKSAPGKKDIKPKIPKEEIKEGLPLKVPIGTEKSIKIPEQKEEKKPEEQPKEDVKNNIDLKEIKEETTKPIEPEKEAPKKKDNKKPDENNKQGD